MHQLRRGDFGAQSLRQVRILQGQESGGHDEKEKTTKAELILANESEFAS